MSPAKKNNVQQKAKLTRREAIVAGVTATPLLAGAVKQATAADSENNAVGPILGHVDHEMAIIWYRPNSPGEYIAKITNMKTRQSRSAKAQTSLEHDSCITWRFDNLDANSEYAYSITHLGKSVADGINQRIHTAPPVSQPTKTVLAMGSCASSTKFFDVWAQIAKHNIDALMLLGDTPYIDNRQLNVNRMRHREFLSIPTLAKLGASTPVWGTWDDHDFGGNDTDGKIANKQAIRQAFTEYRAQKQFGDGKHGVYTKFRHGPIEVFMIDPRYFSQSEPSPVDSKKPTCLGKTQWNWLRDGLKQSTAPFKLLATGMIWDDKKNGEKDDGETYVHER
ncbi:MAG: alkaline phosphatase D family protein [Planctomycetota bacterium]|nr:alkaline phosphatase D family protein [Planctomycetota bacterium]